MREKIVTFAKIGDVKRPDAHYQGMLIKRGQVRGKIQHFLTMLEAANVKATRIIIDRHGGKPGAVYAFAEIEARDPSKPCWTPYQELGAAA